MLIIPDNKHDFYKIVTHIKFLFLLLYIKNINTYTYTTISSNAIKVLRKLTINKTICGIYLITCI